MFTSFFYCHSRTPQNVLIESLGFSCLFYRIPLLLIVFSILFYFTSFTRNAICTTNMLQRLVTYHLAFLLVCTFDGNKDDEKDIYKKNTRNGKSSKNNKVSRRQTWNWIVTPLVRQIGMNFLEGGRYFLSRIWYIARIVFGMYSNINLSFTKPLISTIRRPNQYQALINYNIEIDHILFMTIYHRWIINTHWYNYVHKNDTHTHTRTHNENRVTNFN